MGRLLAYRTLGLGDLLTTVPALRALHRHAPHDQLVLATTAAMAPLADLVGGVAQVLPTGQLGVPAWSGPPPDWAVNLHGSGPQSHRALAALHPRRLTAFGCPSAGVPGPAWDPQEHEVARWCRLLAESGVPADPDDLALRPPARPPVRRAAVVVHPGAAAPRRRWPADRFATVARMLVRAGEDVVVTGVADEEPIAREVADRAGLGPGQVLAGRLGILDLAALVAAARLVVCGDTGVAHLATAYGTPSVVLFGPVSPALWGPPPDRRQHRALWPGPARDHGVDPSGDPAGVDPRLLAIDPDEVLAHARQLLAA